MSYFWKDQKDNIPKITLLIWSPVGHFESSFGHISVVITKSGQDLSYSLSPKGCDIRAFNQYMDKQSFRDGYAFKLKLSTEQAIKIAYWMSMNFIQDGKHQVCNYGLLTNNCTDPLKAAFLYAGITIGTNEKLPVKFAYALWKNGLVAESFKIAGCVHADYPFLSAILFLNKHPWDKNSALITINNCTSVIN